MSYATNTHLQPSGRRLFVTLRNYLSFWPLIVAALLVSLGLAWVYLQKAIPLYSSTATILIKDPEKGIEDSKLFNSMDIFGSKKRVENEIEILHSRKLMQEVVKNLALYAPVYREGESHPELLYELSPLKIELKNPDYLAEKDKIPFSYLADKRLVIEGKNIYPLNIWVNSPWGLIRFVPNPRYKGKDSVSEMFFSLVSIKKITARLLDALELTTISKASTIVDFNLLDQDPERAEDILNELIHVYNYNTIKNKNTVAASALTFVEKRIHYYLKELDSMERAIQKFRVDEGVVDMSTQGKLFLGSVAATDERLGELNVKLAILEQVESYILSKSGFDVQRSVVPQGSRELSTGSKDDSEDLADARTELKDINDQIEKLPAVPVVNSYKNMQIINLQNRNRALSRDSGNPEVRDQIDANMRQILELQQQVTSDSGSMQVGNQRTELLRHRKELESSIASLRSRAEPDKPAVRETSGDVTHEMMVPSLSRLDDGIIAELLQKYNDVEVQYERLRKITAQNNAVLVSLQDQLNKMKPDILENIRTQRSNIEAEKQSLQQVMSQDSSIMRAIPEKERQLVEITRQQSVKNNIYTYLLRKREEAALSVASAISDSRLVDYAESFKTPVSPKSKLVYSIALFLGLSLSLGYILLKEMMNPAIVFRSDIEALTRFPIIGEISYAGAKKPLVISEGDQTYVAEQLRQVRTTLMYQGIKRKFLVTSSIAGEGKSFIASNIAVSIAMAEKTVALIELDLHKPKLAGIFDMEAGAGISEYLAGKATAEEIIRQTALNENLFLIQAGAVPVNPSELILKERLDELFRAIDTRFDYLILETAPVNAVTDAYILSRFSDAILYIVRQGKTKKADLQLMEETLRIRGLNNAVIIFNGVRPDSFSIPAYPYKQA